MKYLAYGSNLHLLRLVDRVPNVCFIGITKLERCRLVFHKQSIDGSSKCTLTFGDDSACAWGAIYEIPEIEVQLLDKVEGLNNGYDKHHMSVNVAGEDVIVFTYLASKSHLVYDLKHYHWYKAFVLAGAHQRQFPKDYLEYIDGVDSQYDNDLTRRTNMENILVQLR